MTTVSEIAPDVFRISTFVPDFNLQFNQFLVRDDEPLLCSDLFHQSGDVEPATHSDVLGRCRQVLVEYQQGPLANYMPYATLTEPTLHRLAGLQPKTLATMHGSAYIGDGSRALRDLATMFKEVLGPK